MIQQQIDRSRQTSGGMTASVVAALRASGSLNAGTPVAMASVPVRPTEPAEKARTASSTRARLLMSAVASESEG